ncbi:LOW QUALITY PROTEIN: uncharacterized protein PV09_01322 [Verruconis gallopava]|uniref:RING-type domain-containing protein n=1 Tax=Verruconis gallopava TaxID=253628 RepID=A0A0D1Y029_9PEZI|nr:LOW QUALITY PROTEIN: uncharacterized protein PV09_01322 [Verruconis gallopava]KIW08416.1 LOW QUALITY PROTEIN: hypothetical protein PV09_01322 [Verruconis gallopava]
MQRAELEVWKVCWKVNAAIEFCEPERKASEQDHVANSDPVVSAAKSCRVCKKPKTKLRESAFARMTKCAGNHTGSKTLICPQCDINFVWAVVTRQQECFHEDCRRKLAVVSRKMETYRFVDSALFVYVLFGSEWEAEFLVTGSSEFFQLLSAKNVFSCIVCSETVTYTHGASLTPRCQHDASLCKPCAQWFLSAQVGLGNWRKIGCPELGCKQVLDGDDMKRLADTDTLDK